MSKPVFQWNPDLGAQKSTKPTVYSIKFGDGYEQRIPVGINSKPHSWQVKFTRSLAEAESIGGFLEARGGVEAFTWTDPGGSVANYVCREWTQSKSSFGVCVVSGTFEQVFEY